MSKNEAVLPGSTAQVPRNNKKVIPLEKKH